jgi:ATP-GRASP peptide maturase of grasp-with-spasm system
MITIFSKSKFEGTTDDVIDWLSYFGGNFIRINGFDYFNTINYENDRNNKSQRGLNEVQVCWFRRWLDDDFFNTLLNSCNIASDNRHILENHLHREFNLLSNELWRSLRDKKWITKPSEIALKKLEVIDTAFKIGLLVPSTLVTSSKNELIEFKKKNTRIISKTIGDVPNFRSGDLAYSIRTVEIDDSFIEQKIQSSFFPSLFQALIEKEFELRIFFLIDKFYAMAIFSQNDKQTELDFRNYNKKKPNRVTRFKLPALLEDKLKVLVADLKLTTGSIDMIRQKETGDYYLLEINPVGQIGMTSYPCNYYLEREIAKQLIDYDKREF